MPWVFGRTTTAWPLGQVVAREKGQEVHASIRLVGVGAGVLGLTLASVTVAQAYTADNITVSCDTAYTTTLVTIYASGDVSYKQRDTTPDNNRYNWAVSDLGNSLSWKATNDGETAPWQNVIASNYTFKTRIVSNTNCNGISPGNGNSKLNYTVNP